MRDEMFLDYAKRLSHRVAKRLAIYAAKLVVGNGDGEPAIWIGPSNIIAGAGLRQKVWA